MEAVNFNHFDFKGVKGICPYCGNEDNETLYAIKEFDYAGAELPFAIMCGRCCHVEVFDAADMLEDEGEW